MEILAKAGNRDGDEGQNNASVRTVLLFSLSLHAHGYDGCCDHEMSIVFILEHCAVLENIHAPPQKGLEFSEGGVRFGKTKKFKKKYMEFPEGWGHHIKYSLFRGSVDILWNYTLRKFVIRKQLWWKK